ncbi:MAG: hypothetical protein ACI9FN_001388 [Saprospiraceae bacterium]|jgi:hypothetical protein
MLCEKKVEVRKRMFVPELDRIQHHAERNLHELNDLWERKEHDC